MMALRLIPLSTLALGALAAATSAQFNNQWVEFVRDDAALPGGATSVSDGNTEVDFAWGDLDMDGDTDLVVVRKQPFTSAGKRTNVLLMNEGGVLVDRTSTLAVASDVPGDNGFLTATNDRDVVLSDVDGDGWLDVITATTLSDGDPKHIGHPRIYMNLGGSPWQGLRNEDARVPQLIHFGTLAPENPRFCAVAAGDVTGDGAPDLYFGDYDSSGAGGVGQPGNKDLNDRLLINDGNGFFTDQSQLRMSSTMLQSAFGMAVEIEDINLDGANDVIKDTALMSPQYVAASYNDPNNEGFFNVFDSFHTNAPYHIDIGDLNNDNRPDIVVTDDFADRYRLNTGVDTFGRVIWSSSKTFEFVSGSDDGFGSNNLIVDLDEDGWNDVIICDVDVDISGYNRRIHIYHNATTVPGTTDTTLIEEREEASGGFFAGETGWLGAVGLEDDDLEGGHDVAVFDLDGDGDKDMILGRSAGTFVWKNQLDPIPGPTCGFLTYGTEIAGPVNVLSLDGAGHANPGGAFSAVTTGLSNDNSFYAASGASANEPLVGGTGLVDLGQLVFPLTAIAGSGGTSSWDLVIPNNPALVGVSVYFQSASPNAALPNGWELSNGLEVLVCP